MTLSGAVRALVGDAKSVSPCLLAMAVAAMLLAPLGAALRADEVFDARGFNRNRDFFSQLPYEHIDPMTGNLLLTFTDLVLPGNAGFDLRIQRTYNSKIYRDQTFGTLDEDNWAGIGWSLHLGRVRSPNAAVPGPVEMSDGSAHKLFRHVDGSGRFITRDYWVYDRNTSALQLTDGLVYTFGHSATLPSGQQFRYVTRIEDPFGNRIDVAYLTGASVPPDGIQRITQTVGVQVRTVDFTYEPTFRTIRTMTSNGRTWTYSHAATVAAGFHLLTAVQPPVGRGWSYGYQTAGSPRHELTNIDTPQGGGLSYAYSTVTFNLGSTVPIQSRSVTRRTTGGRDIPGGNWTYAYAQGSGRNQSVIDAPCGTTTTYTFLGIGNYATQGAVWRIGLPSQTVITGGGGSQTEALSWIQSAAISNDQETIGFNNDTAIFVPLQQTRTITRDGQTYRTTYGYNGSNFNDYGRPASISEAGELSRTTSRVFTYNFGTRYIRDRLASETLTVGSSSFTRSYGYDLSGFKTSESIFGITRTFARDGQGNVARATDAENKSVLYSYSWGAVQQVQTPAYAITRSINPDGTVASETRRGFTTSFAYDALSRPTRVDPPVGNAIVTAYDSNGAFTQASRGPSRTRTDLDGFGRPSGSSNNVGVRININYDACGRRVYESYPFTTNDIGSTYAFDALGRMITKTHPDGRQVFFAYSTGIDVTVRDEENKNTFLDHSAFGNPDELRLVGVRDAANQITWYGHNALGSLTSVTRPSGSAGRTFAYNGRNELTAETHPENGAVTYSYSANGNLVQRTDGAGTTSYGYDGNNRLTAVDGPGTAYDVQIQYDESDNRMLIQNGHIANTYGYDGANRQTGRADIVIGQTFSSGFGYDGNDNLTTVTYPSGLGVSYTYDAENRISSVSAGGSVVASAFSYHPSGAPLSFTSGNGIVQSFGYDNRYRQQSYSASGVLGLTYGYDGVGNTVSITDTRGGTFSQGFAYDSLDRLTSFSGMGGGSFSYDAVGNRTSKTLAGLPTSYQYQASTQRLASATGAEADSFVYDNRGNLTASDGGAYQYIRYIPTNMLEEVIVRGVGTQYRYDGDNLRRFAIDAWTKRYFLPGLGSQILSEMRQCAAGGPIELARDDIYAGARLLASRRAPSLTCGNSPSLSLSDASAAEGNAGPTEIRFSLTLSGPINQPVSVDVTTGNGTAIAGTDYVARTVRVTIPATQTAVLVPVEILGDTIDEDDETFVATLSNPAGATIADNQGVGTIFDDDNPPAVSIGDCARSEALTPCTFSVTLSAPSSRTVSVSFATANGTALAPNDYAPSAGTLTFPPGTTSQPIPITVQDDVEDEAHETFSVILSNSVNATVGDGQGLGTIIDNDGPPPGAGDFNLDGKSDLVWRNDVTGEVAVWFMDGLTLSGGTGPPVPVEPDRNWKIVGVADFDVDGHPDLLWRHLVNGENSVWFMNGVVPRDRVLTDPPSATDPNWKIVGTGDFSSDGKPDILWRHSTSGLTALWYMDGARLAGGDSVEPTEGDSDWRIAGTGDFNDDGKVDILWRHAVTGEIRVWFMSGVTMDSAVITTPSAVTDLNWQIVAIGDYSGDRKPDIVWHHAATGQIGVWFMDGATAIGGGFTDPDGVGLDPNWKLVGPK